MRVSCLSLLAAAAMIAVSLQLPAQSRPKSPTPSVPYPIWQNAGVPDMAGVAGMGSGGGVAGMGGLLTNLRTPSIASATKRHGTSFKDFVFENFTCYALRVYHFSRVSPYSDAMKRKGYSTCEPAQLFHADTVTKLPK